MLYGYPLAALWYQTSFLELNYEKALMPRLALIGCTNSFETVTSSKPKFGSFERRRCGPKSA